jgi:putative transcriptional regulator
VNDSGSSKAESSRPTDALLAAYAAGTLSEPFAVLVAAHLQMRAAREPAGPAIRSHEQLRTPGADQMNIFMPLALRSYVGRHLGVPEWRTIWLGLEQCRISTHGGIDASFLRCRPGRAIPAHTHRGLEAALVLQGGFRDAGGHYLPGDIAVADGTVDHRPIADRDGTCMIFIVQEAALRLTGPIGRLIQRMFGA